MIFIFYNTHTLKSFLSCLSSYRLAPEVYFPGQYEDAIQACRNILTDEVLTRFSMDPRRLAVSGDSAGGNLAAAVAQEVNV